MRRTLTIQLWGRASGRDRILARALLWADPLLGEFDGASDGPLGDILTPAAGTVHVARDPPSVIHGLPVVVGQEANLELAHPWIDEVTRCRTLTRLLTI